MSRNKEIWKKDTDVKQDFEIRYQKNFHNEKEWRFVPKLKDIQTVFPEEYPVILNEETANKIDIDRNYSNFRSTALSTSKVSSLQFEYKDIRYLIVPGANERKDLIALIDSLKFKEEDSKIEKYLLCSKILTLDEIRKDM